MQDYNSALTDQELRELFKTYILEQDEDHFIHQQIIDMEAKIAFGAQPMIALPIGKETEMMKQLSKKMAAKSSWHLWLIGLGITVATVAVVMFQMKKGPEKQETIPAVPVEQNEAPVKDEPAVPGENMETPKDNHQVNVADMMPLNNHEVEKTNEEPVISPVVRKEAGLENNQDLPERKLKTIPPVVSDKKDKEKDEAKDTKKIDTLFDGVKRIEFNTDVCHIEVKKGSGSKVSLKGEITAECKSGKEGPFYDLKYNRKGDVLEVVLENNNRTCKNMNFSANLNAEVPSGTEVKIRTSNGNVKLDDLDGKTCDIASTYGHITASHIKTSAVLHTTSGNMQLTNMEGDVNISSTYGNVTMDMIKGNLKLNASSGNIKLNKLTGSACYIDCDYGNILLTEISADLTIMATSGHITLTDQKGNAVLKSQYGNQKITGMTGNLNSTSSSGHITVAKLKGDIKVNATYGNIVTDDFMGNIDISSQSGNITGKNVQVEKNMNIAATYGDIRMQLNNKTDDLSFDLRATTGDLNIKKDGLTIKSEDGKLQINKGNIIIKGLTISGDQVYE